MKRLFCTVLAFVALACCAAASAQDASPSKVTRMIVVYPAGGGADLLARTLGDSITRQSGQRLIVENRAGASGMIGTTACKNAAPDGYTYCLVLSDVVTIHPHVFKKITYDAEKDLVPVASVADFAVVLAANSTVPVKDMKELAAYSRANKDKVNWGSFGVASSSHLMLTRLNESLDGSVTHVPYQGVPQLISALLNKEIDVSLLIYGQVAQYLDKGQMKVLGVMGTRRAPMLPDVPTFVEQGLNFAPVLWYGVFAPAGTPPLAVERMNKLVNQALEDAAVRKVLETQGFFAAPSTPTAFGERAAQDRNSWGPIARSLNLSLD
ncbi:tripartite tricarboxylate transporter substrate binding protein [Vineibacter terrae]|uniref:Tripartite tricarboxylate transporter substrate binding protein n=1 Tax=Vineibacter terrae TaxID=2586908 RepID=A0A5C8PE68_9HYPH|nr:tripartite tricarboxylate transporter substrate binding protein [Vineibacter terrae]TXL71623.1 tripartite tricarboxylate transporter substrate binding protein [Vineibacter terrae]